MRTRINLLDRVVRAEVVESLQDLEDNAQAPAPRILWAQAYDLGDKPAWWTVPESGYDVERDDWFDDVPSAARISTDYLPDWPMRLRWKIGMTKAARELKGSRIHDGDFDRLEGAL